MLSMLLYAFVAGCGLHAVGCILLAACYVPWAACGVLHFVACGVLHFVACCTQRAACCCMLHAACCRVVCCTQRAACCCIAQIREHEATIASLTTEIGIAKAQIVPVSERPLGLP
jgi:hypothetical protein